MFLFILLYNSENLLSKIFDKLTELTEKVDRIERHLNELDDKINESYNLSQETDFIKVFEIIF
jgi:uncharacterized coiled-coil protein SlyX